MRPDQLINKETNVLKFYKNYSINVMLRLKLILYEFI